MTDNLTAIEIAVQARIPVFLWGPPGIGKTKTIEAFAEVLGEDIWTVILSIREPSDQGGLPVITPEGVRMEPPMWAKQLDKKGRGIVFFDEFNTAAPTTQSSALRVIYGGWAGDLKLPEETSFMAAGNPPETSSGAYDLTSAIANRWAHFDWTMDPVAWVNGMVSGWPTPKIPRISSRWKEALPTTRADFASFISKHSTKLHSMPEDPAAQGRAWPSPRTWDMAAALCAAAASCGYGLKSEVARQLIAACVGGPAQREFSSWHVKLDLRDPEEYLADPMGTPLPKRQDQIMATLNSVAAASLSQTVERKKMVRRYQAAWRVLGRVADDKPDLAIPPARILAPSMPSELDENIPPEVEKVLPTLLEGDIDFSRRQA